MKWTKHAITRIKQTPFKIEGIKKMFKTAYKSELSKRVDAWKFSLYGMKQSNIVYYRKQLEILYTVSKEDNTVITVTVKDKNTGKIYAESAFDSNYI